ncbi:MAG: transporter substrate-binding domain-containing protein [Muribaculaceae bacterium]|nr:transporter substrate-binding domain-containing protein [Muribaculaceae bacterium]
MNPQPIKGKLPILISLLILVLSGMWLLSRCSHTNERSIANQFTRPTGDTIAVAIEMSPTSYFFSGDTAVGFDYEMLNAIAKAHDLNLIFQPFVPVDYALDGLKKGQFDVVVATLPASSSLQNDFLSTDEVFVDRQVLVKLKDNTADSIETTPSQFKLLKDTVWITDSSPYRERIRNLSSELGDTIYIMSDPEYNAEQLVILTALGEIKQAVVNETIAKRIAQDYPQIDISTPVSLSQFQPWLLPQNKSDLRDSLNRWIEQFKQTPEYSKLTEKYFK